MALFSWRATWARGTDVLQLWHNFIWPSLVNPRKSPAGNSQSRSWTRDLFPGDNPAAPLQMCVLSEPGITTPHLDDHKPHEDAAAAEVTCEDLSHTSEGGKKACFGQNSAMLHEDGKSAQGSDGQSWRRMGWKILMPVNSCKYVAF